MKVINLVEKFSAFHELWSPKIIAELNDSYVKLGKLKGEFEWHHHDQEDELFLVVKGTLIIRLKEKDLTLHEGELAVIPRGVEHCPVAAEEVHLMMIEPKTTLNTGTQTTDRTVNPEWI